MRTPRVVVIGGGAAGLMAAGRAAELSARVTVFEKNDTVGRKLSITGKGRCNVTNFCDNDTFIAHLTSNARFMYGAVSRFSCYDTVDFFNRLGVDTVVERGNRVFPRSGKAADIVDALYDYVVSSGGEILSAHVKGIDIADGCVRGVRLYNRTVECDRVIVATGGMSYPSTGSTGDGYAFARAAGHTVTKLLPSLVPLVSRAPFCAELQGLSLRNIRLTIVDNDSNKEIYSQMGELLFTHFGISGPLVLSASAHMRSMTDGRYTAVIDLKPALTPETLDRRLLRDFSDYANRDIVNALRSLLPKSMIPVILRLSGIDPHTKCREVSVLQRRELLTTLKQIAIPVSGFRPLKEAIVTSGGVAVSEVNPKTMESKLVRGLYFSGEVLDLDAYTGGFNLQIAFSTGRLAGENAAQ